MKGFDADDFTGVVFGMPHTKYVIYKASVRLAIETSDIIFNPTINRRQMERVLSVKPAWELTWPPPLSHDDSDVLKLALFKFKSLFDVAPQLPDGSAGEIRDYLYREFSRIPRESAPDRRTRYRRLLVDAIIWDEGSVTWGFQTLGEGDPPPSLEEHRVGKKPAADVFVQNLVRADLQERIESLPT